MHESATDITRDELIGYARHHGFRVTATQLQRWHKAGVLHRPARRSLGRGHGMESRYPDAARSRVLLICKELQSERSLDGVLWRLWWDHDAIEETVIRRTLDASLIRRVRASDRLVADRYADDISEDDIVGVVGRASQKRLVSSVRRIRRRVGTKEFPSFLHTLAQIGTGTLEATRAREDARLFAKAVGLDRAPDARHDCEGDDATAALMMGAAKLLDPKLQSALLQDAESGALTTARNELRAILASAPVLFPLFELFAGQRARDTLTQLLSPRDSGIEAMGFLAWLVCRQTPPVRHLAVLVTHAAHSLREGAPLSEVVAQLERGFNAAS